MTEFSVNIDNLELFYHAGPKETYLTFRRSDDNGYKVKDVVSIKGQDEIREFLAFIKRVKRLRKPA